MSSLTLSNSAVAPINGTTEKTGALYAQFTCRRPCKKRYAPSRCPDWIGGPMVGTGRFELPTSRLSVVRSNQLSYAPVVASHYGTQPIWHRPSGIELSGRDSLGGGGRGVHPLFFLRKEVIQPQVPLRLPCYDFTPVADLTVVGCLLKGWRTAFG